MNKKRISKPGSHQNMGEGRKGSSALIPYHHPIWGIVCIISVRLHSLRLELSFSSTLQQRLPEAGSWGTPASTTTPRFDTSLEHRLNSSCIIRLSRPSTPTASYIPLSTRMGAEGKIWRKSERYPSVARTATNKLVVMQQRRGKTNTWCTNMQQRIGGSAERYLPFPFPNRQPSMGVPGMGYRGEEKKRGGKRLPLAAASLR